MNVLFCHCESQQHGSASHQKWLQGFKKCCISTAVDETDDGMLWNESEEGGNIGSECEEDEGTDCADGESITDW